MGTLEEHYIGRAALRAVNWDTDESVYRSCGDSAHLLTIDHKLITDIATELTRSDELQAFGSESWDDLNSHNAMVITVWDSGSHTVEWFISPECATQRIADIRTEWERVDDSAYVVLWSRQYDSLILARGIGGVWHSVHLQGDDAHDTLEYLSNCDGRYTVPVALTEYVLWDVHQNLADCKCDSDQIVELATGSSYRALYGSVE